MNYLLNMVKKYCDFNKTEKKNKGYALPIVLIMLSLLAALSIFLMNRNIKEFKANQKSLDYEICILTAKNAMEEIKVKIDNQENTIEADKEDLNGGHYQYQILKVDENHYEGVLKSSYREDEKVFFIKINLEKQNFFWEMESVNE